MDRPLTLLRGRRFQCCIRDDAIADVYAEVVHENSEEEDESDSDYQAAEEEECGSEGDGHVISVPIAIANPTEDLERYSGGSDWEHENSKEDEEAKQYRRHAKMVKKGVKGREDVCEALVQVRHQVPQLYIDEELDAGNDTPYFDSSEEASYDDDEGLEISGSRKKSKFLRFDGTAPLPIFLVGMTFRGRHILPFLKMRREGSEPSVPGLVALG
ncbi:hypothetical protein SEVIR_9G269700v4 [Setaria viridis]